MKNRVILNALLHGVIRAAIIEQLVVGGVVISIYSRLYFRSGYRHGKVTATAPGYRF